MRKSELLAIKAREYERGVVDTHKKFRVGEEFIEEWADILADPHEGKEPSEIGDLLKQMLTEIGVEIVDG